MGVLFGFFFCSVFVHAEVCSLTEKILVGATAQWNGKQRTPITLCHLSSSLFFSRLTTDLRYVVIDACESSDRGSLTDCPFTGLWHFYSPPNTIIQYCFNSGALAFPVEAGTARLFALIIWGNTVLKMSLCESWKRTFFLCGPLQTVVWNIYFKCLLPFSKNANLVTCPPKNILQTMMN